MFPWSVHWWKWGVEVFHYYCGMCALCFSEVSFMNLDALHLEHICSELRGHLARFFLWWVCNVILCLFWLLYFGSLFFSQLEWLHQLVSWNHLLGKLFSTLLLWGSVCLCHWSGILVCSKMLSPVYISSLLVYVFYLGIESIDIKRY